jgi:hypothetical protein
VGSGIYIDFQIREIFLDAIGIGFKLAVTNDRDSFATVSLGDDPGDKIKLA